MGWIFMLILWALGEGIRCESCSGCADGESSGSENLPTPQTKYEIWVSSLFAACVIGLSGIAPLIFIPLKMSAEFSKEGGCKGLRLLLSFAVGGLLGDVFLHLLPEAWDYQKKLNPAYISNHITLGLWVLLGMFSFIIIEIMFTASKTDCVPGNSCNIMNKSLYKEKCSVQPKEKFSLDKSVAHHQNTLPNGHVKPKSGLLDHPVISESQIKPSSVQVAGYLNLMANSIDNFTHGLAVAASFLVGCKMGVLTTFAILIHEIPHEIGDFAILLKSGFNPWAAAKAQISTSTIGLLGVIVALSAESIDQVGICTLWILPFTAGGFLNIALVNVLPDLLKEKDPWESVKQLVCICAGIGIMGIVSIFV